MMTITPAVSLKLRWCALRGLSIALIAPISAFFVSWLGQSAVAAESICERLDFEGAPYIVCSFKPAAGGLRLFWRDDERRPYRQFSTLATALAEKGQVLKFAMNAGMYREDFTPMGLYVEDGREIQPLNTGNADRGAGPVPNFYKKPNGVFYLTRDGAGILPTDRFLKAQPDALYATQSGPMLVISGKLHPALIAGSEFTNRRSGVAVCEDGAIRFAISERGVNFHDFARLFRDFLGCRDALFLDGGGGAGIYLPDMGRNDFSWHGGYGPMIGLVD
jgi:uncharacterized protein YigE (DUF2233 family)